MYELAVTPELKEYTIPLERFAPSPSCKDKPEQRQVADTLPKLDAFTVASVGISSQPIAISVGPTTLTP